MVSEGIEKLMDLIFTETKMTNQDLEVMIGELVNRFGEREVLDTIKHIVWERQEAKFDHIRGDAEELAKDSYYNR